MTLCMILGSAVLPLAATAKGVPPGVARTHKCTRKKWRTQPLEHLGHPFHGAGRLKGFPLEDQYVFEHHFSAAGMPPYRTNGTFVELGAHDGVYTSNTAWFEAALGWRGVLVEASARAFLELQRNRGRPGNTLRNAVVCAPGQTVRYVEPRRVEDVVLAGKSETMAALNQRHVSALAGGIEVRELACVPLSQILAEASISKVDFFSLDCEGGELDVLRTIDWHAVTFDVIMVEQDSKNATKDEEIRGLLRQNGYVHKATTGEHCTGQVWQADRK